MTARQQPVSDRMPAERQRLALQGFFGIIQGWGVDNGTARRILGSPPERTFFEWKKGNAGRVPEDKIVYSERALADGWVRRPNEHLGGATPLQRMAAT